VDASEALRLKLNTDIWQFRFHVIGIPMCLGRLGAVIVQAGFSFQHGIPMVFDTSVALRL
jgi:hypothetical protein